MTTRRILFIDAARLSAYCWSGGEVTAEGTFTASPGDIEAFAAYLKKNSGSIFYLLADIAEEGFQLEEIPFLRGSDRTAFIKRKLGQYYYGTPLSAALTLGRLKDGRRDERMLFAALTRPQHFEAWLDALRGAEVSVAGLFSLPQAMAPLAASIAATHKRFLLITLTDGGLRQTFFEDGQLRFSRLTVLATGTLEEAALTCSGEAAKIYQYLSGQRLVTRGQALDVVVLAHPAQFNTFRSHCRDSDELHFDYLDVTTEGRRNGLKNTLQDSRSDSLFAHILIRKTPTTQFLPDEARQIYRVWQVRVGLINAGVVALAGCLLFAGKQLYDVYHLAENTDLVRMQNEVSRQKYDAALQSLPKIPLSNDNLRALVDHYEQLVKRSPGIQPAYLTLSAALQDYPQVELEQLKWTIAEHVDDAFSGLAGDKPQAMPAAQSAPGPFAVLDVSATLPVTMANDHRGQLDIINGLANRLRAFPGVQVRILSLPFDAESGKAIKSSGGAATVEAPKLRLRVAQSL